jgi:hemoglobin-like flavoprotein
MDPTTAEIVNDSLDRCNGTILARRFYDRFMASSQAVRDFFKGVDMQRQRREVTASLYMMLLASQGRVGSREYLEQVAQSHARRHIPPEMYDTWLECLLQTVQETDPLYNETVGAAWREIMTAGVDFMKARAVLRDG